MQRKLVFSSIFRLFCSHSVLFQTSRLTFHSSRHMFLAANDLKKEVTTVLTIRKPIIVNPAPEDPAKAAPEEGKSQPTKRLPTYRIKFSKQLDIIRTYGVKSQNGARAANYKDVSEVVGIHANTISLLVGFLVENGFLERNGDATMPTKPVLEFAQAYSWSPDIAPKKLDPIIRC